MTPSVPADDRGEADLRSRVVEFLAGHPPETTDPTEFLRARFDAGLAWVHYPPGLGGLGLARSLQPAVDRAFADVGAPRNQPERNTIGLGMAAPTILAYGTEEQQRRFMRPLWTGEEIWCQLFSEPGAGSDLAALGTRAVRAAAGGTAGDGDATAGGTADDGDAADGGGATDDGGGTAGTTDGGGDWIVNGQKVWTSMAHEARWAIMVARTDPDVPKHQGITYFIVDMTAPGVEVRPLRQLTGEAEFNEVFLTDVRIPDDQRLGPVGGGWRVAQTTLNNERVAIGGAAAPREGGMIGVVAQTWRLRPELRTPGLRDALLRLWVEAEVSRIAGMRLRQLLAAGHPGPEGSATKLVYARLNQQISALELELLREDGMRYDDWSMRRPRRVDITQRTPGFRYLRARGNSIEGGTSEIIRNVIAERVLGLPGEIRTDKTVAWKDLPK